MNDYIDQYFIYKSVQNLVVSAFPDHLWQRDAFVNYGCTNTTFLALQFLAQRVVRSIFPDNVIASNWRGITSSLYNRAMEIDIYLPELGLGFEYQV